MSGNVLKPRHNSVQCSTRREGIIVCLTICLISLESFVLEL